MAVDRTRTLRGALAGVTAAAVWTAQQPLDRRVFGVDYDDADLLGRFVARGRAAYPIGVALHLLNGAVFGAVYANLRSSVPAPAALRGPLAGLVEHVATWPGTVALARVNPEIPALWDSGRAFAQATWRHLLFGAVLGEVERRLNPPDTEPRPVDAVTAASNGHGSAEHLVSISPELTRVLITGASGFAGRHLVAACRADGDHVIEGPPSKVADLRDPEAAVGVLAAARPEVIYHLAAQAHVGRSWEDPGSTLTGNLAMTLNMLEAVRAEAPSAVFMLACSSEEYGPPLQVPTTEDELLKPANPYAVSKASCDLLGGLYAAAHGLRVVRARAFNHSGPGQEPVYAVANFARQVAAGLDAGDDPVRVVTGNPDTRRDFTDVRDVVRAYRLLAARGEPGIFNVCSGVSHSAREVLAALGRVTGTEVVYEVDPARVRANEVMEVRGSFARLHEATGWEPSIPFEQTLADTVDYWRATR